MKILMVVHSFLPESFAGVEVHVYNLARILGRRHEVHVLSRFEDKNAPDYGLRREEYEGVSVIRLINNEEKKDYDFPEIVAGVRRTFASVLDDLRPDLVHFHHLIHLSSDLVNETVSRGIPSVATLHDYWYLCCRVQLYIPGRGRCKGPTIFRCPNCFPVQDEMVHSLNRLSFLHAGAAQLWKRLFSGLDWSDTVLFYERRFEEMREVLSKFDHIIANSRHVMKRYLQFGAPGHRMAVMRYGLDKAMLSASRHEPAPSVRFGFIGSLVEHKGLNVLLDAFRRVPEASLQIFGDPGANATVEAYCKTLSLPPNARFMGGFEHSRINAVLSGIDVLLVPSIWEEAYGLTVDEAKAAGIPVIASRLGGIPEHLRNGREGFLFSPEKKGELERLVRYFAGRPDRVKRMRPTGNDVISLEENAAEVDAVYEQVLRRYSMDRVG